MPDPSTFLLKHADDSGARQDMQVMHDDDQLVDPDLQQPPRVYFHCQERVSLSWEAKALDGLELPDGFWFSSGFWEHRLLEMLLILG